MRVRSVLCVGGSDSGGGAGIQADLKTLVDHRVYGASVVTAVTAQGSRGVVAVEPVSTALVVAQLRAVLDDLPVHAVKTGMLVSAEVVHALCDAIEALPARPPLVVDPVLAATDGTPLLDAAGREALGRLLALATVVTPNLPENALLPLPPGVPVLLKGGHGEGKVVEDRLIHGSCITVYRHRRVTTTNTHGTGCTLASSIAAHLALGRDLEPACRRAVRYVSGLVLRSRDGLVRDNGPLLHGLRSR